MVECAGFENRSARKGSGSSNLPLSVPNSRTFSIAEHDAPCVVFRRALGLVRVAALGLGGVGGGVLDSGRGLAHNARSPLNDEKCRIRDPHRRASLSGCQAAS